MNEFRLRVVSDLHVGSRWGLWPPHFKMEKELYPQNEFNAFLWSCWINMIDDFPAPDFLIVNGDVLDGENPHDRGAGVKAVEVDIQQNAALDVLRPLTKKAKKWALISGTAYHEKHHTMMAQILNAEQWPNGDYATRMGDLIIESPHKVHINIAHHPEGGAVLYHGTTLSKTIMWSIISSTLKKVSYADVIIRSHRHHYACMQDMDKTVVATPCWQLQTPYEVKLSALRYVPDIGFVDLVIRKNEKYPAVYSYLYTYPLNPALVLKKTNLFVK